MNKINSHPKEFGRELSSPDPPLLTLGECPHRGDSSPPPPPPKKKKKKKNSNVFICPVNFQKYWNKTAVIIQTNFSHYINIWLVKIYKFVKNINIWQSAKCITHTEEHTQSSKCVKFQDSYFENHPRNAKMSQSNFVSLCGYFMSCDTPWISRLCELST